MTEPTQTPDRRGFWPLVLLQAQGAFNDSAYKVLLILYGALVYQHSDTSQKAANALITALLPLAFLMFSGWAGMLADKFSKRSVILATKTVELFIMACGFLVFYLTESHAGASHHTFVLGILVAFILFTHSAFFSPSKYGIIPELVPEKRISWANGIIGLTTFLAIIFGSAYPTLLFGALKPDRLHWIPGGMIVLSVIGFLLGLGIQHTPPANPGRKLELNCLPEIGHNLKSLWNNRTLMLTVAGLAYFWGIGAILLPHAIVWGQFSLGLSETGAGAIFVILAMGIGLGSALAGRFSRNHIEVGLVPLGSLGIALFALPPVFATPNHALFMIFCVFMVGVSGGIFTVPLNAILQTYTERESRGGLLAASAYFTDSTILLSAGVYWLITNPLHFSNNGVFLFISVLTLSGTVIVLKTVPEAFVRFISFLIVRLLYRVRTLGLENLPAQGPALLVSNHVSFIDALLIMAISPRPVRFIVWDGFYRNRLMRRLLETVRSIPVSSEQRPRDLLRSLRAASEALKAGEVVCVFAEGQISRTGAVLPFRRGYEYILKDAPAPVIPLYLQGVWGSIFSYEGGKFFWKWPRQIPYPVRLAFGRPLPPTTTPYALRQALLEAGADAAIAAKDETALLHHTLIRQARRHWHQTAMADILSPPITLGQTLWRSVILARRLAPLWAGQETVGVMLPPTVGGALVNYAAALSGRTVVNLNYTTGQDVLERCAERAGIKTVVTARAFLDKVNLTAPGEPIYIEDHRGFHGLTEVVLAIAAAFCLPARWLERYCGAVRRPTPDTLATIIFSSGSTGEPKGVMLSHFNIASNVESVLQGLRLWRHDTLLGVLPFFHSFGYTISLWVIPTVPLKVVHHLSPLDAKLIGELCVKHQVTLIVATPTFLSQYARRIDPAQFGSVRTVVAGAEKLTDRVRETFLEHFGVEPLQGFGTTECAPVVSTNVDNLRLPGFYQVGHKRGSIGHPLPGIAVKTVHVDTGQTLGAGEEGLLWVKGGNVMQGYLGMAEKTAEVLHDGWYNTGDMALIDEDGFIFITGRLSRFSKIGGEMVPHGRVEEALYEALELNEPNLAVTAVPDEAKGEQLVVLHTLDDARINGVNARLSERGLPNLWIPRREMYLKVEQIPLLGTGKFDLKAIKQLALARAGKEGANA